MTLKSFLSSLGIISISTAVILYFLNTMTVFEESAAFTWGVLLFFIALSIGIYFSGKNLSTSKDQNAYTRMILGFMMLKMMLCILMVLAYYKLANPTGKTFIIPFFFIYITYTVFEVVLMSRLGRNT